MRPSPPTPSRLAQRLPRGMRRQQAVIPQQVRARGEDQDAELLEQLRRIQQQVRRAIGPE
jgi:hypothetical protein